MFGCAFCSGGVQLPSRARRFIKWDGSWENMHVSPARQLPITQYLQCVSIKTRAFSRANLLADMVTQVVAKPTIRAEARPSRQPEPTDNTVSLLACRSDRSR